jgi:hypothetical protein
MKALTICQPYASLIVLPDDDERAKRVENRTWLTDYRGPLLIHAGKSRQWLLDHNYGLDIRTMPFGFIVGICELRGCVQKGPDGFHESILRRWPWLQFHEHAEGPFCWVLAECRRFENPIPYRGAQGLFNVPRDVVAAEIDRLQRAIPQPESEGAR